MTPLIPPPVRVRRAGFQPAAQIAAGLRMSGIRACIFAVMATFAAVTVQAAEPRSLPTADIVPDLPAKPPPAPSNDPAVQARIPGCFVWTDRCVTCTRTAGGASCSNIGIACQPQAVECVVTEEDAKKLDDKAEKPDDKTEKKQQN